MSGLGLPACTHRLRPARRADCCLHGDAFPERVCPRSVRRVPRDRPEAVAGHAPRGVLAMPEVRAAGRRARGAAGVRLEYQR